MIYEKRVTVPANTSPSAPVEEILKVDAGIVKLVQVEFPPGCAGLVSVRILHWDVPLWPTNDESAFTGDGPLPAFPESFRLDRTPYEFAVQAWNDDDFYDHSPVVRLAVLPFADNLVDAIRHIFASPYQL